MRTPNGEQEAEEKNQENRAKQPVNPETELAGSAKNQPGQKEKQEVWIGQGEVREASGLQQGKQEAEEKDPENPAKHPVDPETVLEGSAKDQPG
jgi:hypothetical protein